MNHRLALLPEFPALPDDLRRTEPGRERTGSAFWLGPLAVALLLAAFVWCRNR